MTVTGVLNVLQLYFKNTKVRQNIYISEIFALVYCLDESWREVTNTTSQTAHLQSAPVVCLLAALFPKIRALEKSTQPDYFGDRYRPAVIISFNCYWCSRESVYFPCKKTSVSTVSGLLPCSH